MSMEQEKPLITGEEQGRERRRLSRAKVPDDAPEFRALREGARAPSVGGDPNRRWVGYAV